MKQPQSRILDGSPPLHFLEWNPGGNPTVVLLHGNSANAWWWRPVAERMPPGIRLLALDLRGHGDSGWVRPAAYNPVDYAMDLARFVDRSAGPERPPVVVGHSMGGLAVLAAARSYPLRFRGAVAIDVAVTSSARRNRYLRRLRALPTVSYPDLETAKARFRLMPNEGEIPPDVVAQIAEQSVTRTEDGRYTLKFDREAFFGGDGLEVLGAIRSIRIPTLLIRAEKSRIMTEDAARAACESNPATRLTTIRGAHHHVLLERPAEVADHIASFIAGLGR